MALMRLILTSLLLCVTTSVFAENCRVAVAANFSSTLKALQPIFEETTGHQLTLISGSTGKLFAQIQHGAPYDIFLAADSQRPQALLSSGYGESSSLLTYAEGRLVYWSPKLAPSSATPNFKTANKIAIANPKIAPYGAAAITALKNLKSLNLIQEKIVYGNNITQTLHYIASGNSDAGFIALSQFLHLKSTREHYSWVVPAQLHQPIKQQALLLTHGKNNEAAIAFMAFLKTPIAINTIQRMGYNRPSTL